MRCFYKNRIVIAHAIGFATLALIMSASSAQQAMGRVVVSVEGANIRSEASMEGKIVGRAKLGDQFDRLGEDKGWARVALPDGGQGWISNRLLTPLPRPQETYPQKEAMAKKSLEHLRAGNTAYLNGSIPEAIAEFTAAIEANPVNAAAHYNLAVAHHEMGKADEAANSYKKAIELSPTNARARLNLGVLYYEQNRYGEAASELERAIELSPDDPKALYNLAMALEHIDKAKAAAQWEKYIKIASGNSKQAKWVEKAQERLKKVKEAPKK